jgi:hypothetical protein
LASAIGDPTLTLGRRWGRAVMTDASEESER